MPSRSSIHIPKPCHEDWEHMTEQERGRHCAQCDKVVRDFVGMEPAEVAAEVAASEVQICGRVDASALEPMPLAAQGFVAHDNMPRLRMFLVALVAVFGLELFGISSAQAQTLQPIVQSLQNPDSIRLALDSLSKTDVIAIGKVEDVYTREPVAYVNVFAYQGTTLLAGALSDAEGNFRLQFPKSMLEGERYDIRLRYMGRERRDQDISRDATQFVYLIDASMMVEGMTIATEQQNTLIGDLIHCIVGQLVPYDFSRDQKILYRPLDEWLMMNYSEIHHNGRW